MKTLNTRLALAAAVVSAATLIPSAQAQTTPLYIIAGSSALFNTLGYANFEPAAADLTGPNHWSFKSGTTVAAGSGCTGGTFNIVIHDNRNSSSVTIADEPGTVWVAWNADEVASPKGSNPKLSAFINVDSAVGVRAALAVPSAQLNIGAPAGTCGENKVPGTSAADQPLPAAVLADLNAAPTITVAAADIRFEDAKFATTRTLTALGTGVPNTTRQNVKGLGYGGASGPSVGYPIKSSISAATANPVDFALFGNDPISGQPAYPSTQSINIGAGPVMVFVNTTNTGTGHFGDPNLQDIDEWPLAALFSAKLSRTRDAFHTTGLGDFPARMFVREPLSGTYNTFEYNIPNTVRELTTQELNVTNVTPSNSSQNPLKETLSTTGGGRSRAIGTGEMVSAVAANADSIGYAFWGYGNFAGFAPTTIKYLTVNGVDPLFSSYAANPNGPGVFPQKNSSGSYPAIPFPHIADGSYPIWTIFQLVVGNLNFLSNAQSLATAAQQSAGIISDFIPATQLGVFRSHYYTSSVGPYNGHKTGFPNESGGSVGGAPLPIQEDLDTITDTGFENYQELQ
jgi:hypothetical protein